jgi:hypothetical protein
MYEKGSKVKVTVDISNAGLRELEFIGKVVIDATDFMAIQFDTIIIPKMEIKSSDPVPDKPLEELLGAELSRSEGVRAAKPPKVENVRFLFAEGEAKSRGK